MTAERIPSATLKDYLDLPEGTRAELIDSEIYALAAPSGMHSDIAMQFCIQIGNYLSGKTCRINAAPYDVYLDEDTTVVQPDIVVVCDPEKRKENGCHGAPDMVAEVLSPSNAAHDIITKKEVYRRNGVREYWIVDPQNGVVFVHLLEENGTYNSNNVYEIRSKIKVNVLEDCEVDLSPALPPLPAAEEN